MDDDFVRQVYAASYRRLVGQLYGVCGDLGEAEDVVQEAFARAIQHERKFRRTDNPEAWLRTVAVNLSRSRWRRRILGDRLQRQAHRSETQPDLSADHVMLVAALKELPEAQRHSRRQFDAVGDQLHRRRRDLESGRPDPLTVLRPY